MHAHQTYVFGQTSGLDSLIKLIVAISGITGNALALMALLEDMPLAKALPVMPDIGWAAQMVGGFESSCRGQSSGHNSSR